MQSPAECNACEWNELTLFTTTLIMIKTKQKLQTVRHQIASITVNQKNVIIKERD